MRKIVGLIALAVMLSVGTAFVLYAEEPAPPSGPEQPAPPTPTPGPSQA